MSMGLSLHTALSPPLNLAYFQIICRPARLSLPGLIGWCLLAPRHVTTIGRDGRRRGVEVEGRWWRWCRRAPEQTFAEGVVGNVDPERAGKPDIAYKGTGVLHWHKPREPNSQRSKLCSAEAGHRSKCRRSEQRLGLVFGVLEGVE